MVAFAGVRPRDGATTHLRIHADCAVDPERRGQGPDAHLSRLGVRAPHRGRGIASALLSQATREYAARGYDESSLNVDTANPTGALGLYERSGNRVENRTATFERVIATR